MACSLNLISVQHCCTQPISTPKSAPISSATIRQILEDEEPPENFKINRFKQYLTVPITLTLVYSFTPLKPSLAAADNSRSTRKKRSRKTIQADLISQDQIKRWTDSLAFVSDTLPYTDILELKEEGRLKHVVKSPNARLKRRAEVVLVVLDDNQVLRTVLPSLSSNSRFWNSWSQLKIDALCVNAFSPPIQNPKWPQPYPRLLLKGLGLAWSWILPEKESNRIRELKLARERLRRQRKAELVRGKLIEDGYNEKFKVLQKKIEVPVFRTVSRPAGAVLDWDALARDPTVATVLGLFFFVFFYNTVVLDYKKRRKDYDDRVKIERAEAEERKKMKELDEDALGPDDVDAGFPDKGKSNPFWKIPTAMRFINSGARFKRARRKKSKSLQYLERNMEVKFSDVAGLGKIRRELEEVVEFFTHGEIYRRRGVKIPGGILLCGPPGVGKTLLAKAVAGEAGVNFFSISASQFVEIYVGVGAARVRSLYQEAKENAPSIVFIDELDAVGRERGFIKGSGGQERDATLNQLLVCLDGFEGRGEVITIASTNRHDILDPALVRPGRFDRKIFIPKPSYVGRIEILKVHAQKKSMADDVDYNAVAAFTHGMVGAELANIVDVGAINMMRDERNEITTDDLLQAAEIEERGLLEKTERSLETWRRIAINEAAMAVVAMNFPDLKDIEFITISPRAGKELGYVRTRMDDVRYFEGYYTRQTLLDHITVQLAPRAADELWHGEDQLSSISAETTDNARSAARSYVIGGLSEKFHGVSNFFSFDRVQEIDMEALSILRSCYERAMKILEKNRALMESVVAELIRKKVVTKAEFHFLVDKHGFVDSAISDTRKVKSHVDL